MHSALDIITYSDNEKCMAATALITDTIVLKSYWPWYNLLTYLEQLNEMTERWPLCGERRRCTVMAQPKHSTNTRTAAGASNDESYIS